MILNLFDIYDARTQDLHRSLKISGFDHQTLVIEEDGFLPEDVRSIFFAHLVDKEEKLEYKPVFFNEIKVPDFWEITGSQNGGEVFSMGVKKANIIFAEPKNKRFVKEVEWLDTKGRVRAIDRYNQYGWRYSQTVFTGDNKRFSTTYYNQENTEVIVENHLTQDMIVNTKNNKVNIYRNRTEFILAYLRDKQLDQANLWINSLSTPLFVSLGLDKPGEDFLFWQETFSGEVPGNLSFILNQADNRIKKVIVQNEESYQEIRQILPEEQQEKLYSLGIIYPHITSGKQAKNIFILTNSDQVEHLGSFVKGLPDVTFHIAALTEMSAKLNAFSSQQVKLYPNAKIAKIKELLKSCDIYLDINRGAEVLNVIRVAFEYSMLIMGFEETLHQKHYLLKENIYPLNNVEGFIHRIEHMYSNPAVLKHELVEQQKGANAATIEDYQALLK